MASKAKATLAMDMTMINGFVCAYPMIHTKGKSMCFTAELLYTLQPVVESREAWAGLYAWAMMHRMHPYVPHAFMLPDYIERFRPDMSVPWGATPPPVAPAPPSAPSAPSAPAASSASFPPPANMR